MRPRKTLEQWRRAVYQSPLISDAVRVYLLKLADHMSADRLVSVPRSQIARELSRHEQRIAERTKAAIEADFLAVVSKGYKGHTAVYQGTFPTAAGAALRTDLQYAKGPLERYPLGPDCVPDGEYATTRADPSGVVQTATFAATRNERDEAFIDGLAASDRRRETA